MKLLNFLVDFAARIVNFGICKTSSKGVSWVVSDYQDIHATVVVDEKLTWFLKTIFPRAGDKVVGVVVEIRGDENELLETIFQIYTI